MYINSIGGSADGTKIFGNRIGTDLTGNRAIPNFFSGITVFNNRSKLSAPSVYTLIGDIDPARGNVIAANVGSGINIEASTQISVQNNSIGVGANGLSALGNALSGLDIGSSKDVLVSGNRIANNLNGVNVFADSATAVSISRNAIFSNLGLGIDLASDGVTRNDIDDVDTGANDLNNFPDIVNRKEVADNVFIDYSVPTNNFPQTVEFFLADQFGQGQIFLGRAVYAAPGGLQMVNFPAQGTSSASLIVATATNRFGETSEFTSDQLFLNGFE